MARITRRIFAVLMIILGAGSFAGGLARADQPPGLRGELKVEQVWATPGKTGERSILRFRVLNDSREDLQLLDVKTPIASGARIVVRVSDDATSTIGSIVVPSESTIDFTSDHIWIVLDPLTRTLEPGDLVAVELVFLGISIKAEAHVHSVGG